MLENHKNDIENLVAWYTEVKSVILVAEEEDMNGKLYFQPYNELRYAFDHLMRAVGWDLQKNSTSCSDEQKAQLDESTRKGIQASIGHLQRSYSDVCEWYYLNVKDYCRNLLSNYTVEQIVAAIPDYYITIKPRLEKLGEELVTYKETKSSENNDLAHNADIQVFSSHFNELTGILKTVKDPEASLVEIKSKAKKERLFKDIITPIITGAMGALVASLIIYLISI